MKKKRIKPAELIELLERHNLQKYDICKICGVSAATFAPPNVARYMTKQKIAMFLYGLGFAPREYRINGVHKHSWFKGDDLEFERELKKLREKAGKEKEKNIAI